jgi:hypothetical protein
VLAT